MNTSNRPKKIIADANCILSAVCGHAALRIFTETDLSVVMTVFNLQEVEKYIPKMAREFRISREILQDQFEWIQEGIEVKERSFYEDKWEEAGALIRDRDPDDVDLVALALQTGLPIWSNDRDISSLPLQTFSTAALLSLFEL